MEDITYQSYWAEVTAIATSVRQEAKEYDRELSDVLHEAIDGHSWIIYTYASIKVLEHSKNDDAYFENFGPMEANDFSDAVQKMAFAALEADVQEELSSLETEDESDND